MVKTDYVTGYGIVNTICIIFHYALVKRQKNCRKIGYFLLGKAKARGYRGDIKSAFKNNVLLRDMVNAVRELSRYICANDLCEMSQVLGKASPPSPVPETVFRDRGVKIPYVGAKGLRR